MTKRKRYFAEFKAKISLDAIGTEMTTAEPARTYDIQPTMISGWREEDKELIQRNNSPTCTAIEATASAFGGGAL